MPKIILILLLFHKEKTIAEDEAGESRDENFVKELKVYIKYDIYIKCFFFFFYFFF